MINLLELKLVLLNISEMLIFVITLVSKMEKLIFVGTKNDPVLVRRSKMNTKRTMTIEPK
jgi:hypothetical protein